MTKIKLGTRSSKLALAQAYIVKERIESELEYEVEIVETKSIGDKDQTTQLSRFRGQGVFTSHLEQMLLDKTIDLAVHSLKDLPILDNPGLDLKAFIKRNNPADILIIKKSKLLSKDLIKITNDTVIGTGSPRRQSQILARFPSCAVVDIRGNVDTRINKLNSSYIDGVVLSSAIFERIELRIPSHCESIILPIDDFPTTPGQGTIAVQVREGEFDEFTKIDDAITRTIVKSEREVLSKLGGGCELSLGLTISHMDGNWKLNASMGDDNWNPSKPSILTRLLLEGELNMLLEKSMDLLGAGSYSNQEDNSLRNKTILVTKDENLSSEYVNRLSKHGAIVYNQQLIHYETFYDKIYDNEVIALWNNANWVVITSKVAGEFLRVMNIVHPKNGLRIAVIGKSSANRIRQIGLPVHIIAEGNLKSLQLKLEEARESYSGKVLFLSGENITGLPAPDADRIIVYRTMFQKIRPPPNLDYTIVFSKNSAETLLSQLGEGFTKTWVAIGNTTGDFLKSKNLDTKIAKSPTPEGIEMAIMEK